MAAKKKTKKKVVDPVLPDAHTMRRLRQNFPGQSKIIKMKNGSEEIVLIERGDYQVRAPLYEGCISPEYIRVVDVLNKGKELAYWHHDEFMDSVDMFDPSTALAAAFSVIELVFSGQYPPRKERRLPHG